MTPLSAAALGTIAVRAASAPERLGSTAYTRAELAVQATAAGERRDVFRQPTATLVELECHVTTLNPGQSPHPAHQHPQDEMLILEAGSLDVEINGRTTHAVAGAVCLFTSNDPHSVRNAGTEPARYVVLNFTTEETAHRTSPGVTLPAPGTLRSGVFAWDSLVAERKPSGSRRAVFDGPTPTCVRLESHVTTLQAGLAPHPAHHHPDEELIVVRDGVMEVTIAGTSHRLGAGGIAFFASNEEHGLRNVGTGPAVYTIIRVVTQRTPSKPPARAAAPGPTPV